MAVAEWLASGTTADTSLELTLAEGESATVSIFRADGENLPIAGGNAEIRIKSSNGEYMATGFGLSGQNPTLCLSSKGIYVVMRGLSDEAFGVDYEGGTLEVGV